MKKEDLGQQFIFQTLGWTTIGTIVEVDSWQVILERVLSAGHIEDLEEQLHTGTIKELAEWVIHPPANRRHLPRASIIYFDVYPHPVPERSPNPESVRGGWVPPKKRKT